MAGNPLEVGGDRRISVSRIAVTNGFFKLLGVQPRLGRTFQIEDFPVNNQPSAADMGLPAFQIDRHVLMFAIGISLFSAVAFSLASALVQRLSSLVFGIRPTDPWTFAAVSLLMTLVSMAACALPALRAARVDPISTLSSE